jgi:hypothetical protein
MYIITTTYFYRGYKMENVTWTMYYGDTVVHQGSGNLVPCSLRISELANDKPIVSIIPPSQISNYICKYNVKYVDMIQDNVLTIDNVQIIITQTDNIIKIIPTNKLLYSKILDSWAYVAYNNNKINTFHQQFIGLFNTFTNKPEVESLKKLAEHFFVKNLTPSINDVNTLMNFITYCKHFLNEPFTVIPKETYCAVKLACRYATKQFERYSTPPRAHINNISGPNTPPQLRCKR